MLGQGWVTRPLSGGTASLAPPTSEDQTIELGQFCPPLPFKGKQYSRSPRVSWYRDGPRIRILGCCQQHTHMCVYACTHPFHGLVDSQKALTHLPRGSPQVLRGLRDDVPPHHKLTLAVSCSPLPCRQEPPHTPEDPATFCVVTESAHFQSNRRCQHPNLPRHSHQAPDSHRQSPDLIATSSLSWYKPRAGERLSAHHVGARVCTGAHMCMRTPSTWLKSRLLLYYAKRTERSLGLSLSLLCS